MKLYEDPAVSVPFELGTLDGEPAAAVILALHQVSHRRVCKSGENEAVFKTLT